MLDFLDKMGLEWYFVLSNLYGFFEDFDQVRLKPYFQGFERILEGYFDDFINVKSGKNVDFSMFCRTHYRTRK